MTQYTINGRQTVMSGGAHVLGTVTLESGITINVQPQTGDPGGYYEVHDAAAPGLCSIMTGVWTIIGGSTQNVPGSVPHQHNFVNGFTIMTQTPPDGGVDNAGVDAGVVDPTIGLTAQMGTFVITIPS